MKKIGTERVDKRSGAQFTGMLIHQTMIFITRSQFNKIMKKWHKEKKNTRLAPHIATDQESFMACMTLWMMDDNELSRAILHYFNGQRLY